ncbi:LLM class F420-dependent oxidoreductase [Mycobacterium sp. NPDC050853]|uniref:LLM class F420-dependent oxidoreductase n=1 Tax=Mycobacterium sp. NPDC050853 TaxID=3155160 RepID=UPI003410214B
MHVGIFSPITDETPGPSELAGEIEARGFESLFVPEHTHIPVAIEAIHPGWDQIPRAYGRTYDPFVSLAFAAAATTTLRLGTAVTLLVQRDPITFAKETASLDRLSGGRLELGIGSGWLREEMQNHGTNPKTRVSLQTERIDAVTTIWTEEHAEFHGKYVNFDPIQSWPKPLQRPRPPLWLGGWGPSTHERILAQADGWLAPTGLSVNEIERGVAELRQLTDARELPPVPVTVTLLDPQPGDLEQMRELGVYRVLCGLLPATSSEAVLGRLDDLAILLTQ